MKTQDYYWSDSLVARDGKFFIRHEVTRYSEPMRDILYWPVSHATAVIEADLLPLPAHSTSNGSYSVRREPDLDKPVYGYDAHFTVYFPEAGATKASFVESEPIACPKIRSGIETRWRDGKWEKCLKSGWVAA